MHWSQAKAEMLFDKKIRIKNWPTNTYVKIGHRNLNPLLTPWILMSNEQVVDDYWVPTKDEMEDNWEVIKIPNCLHEAPF